MSMETVTNQPSDVGWAWIVAIAGMLTCWILNGMMKMLGMILVDVEREFQASSTQLAVVVSVQSLSNSISSMFVMGIISDVFHLRVLIMTGAVCVALGYSLIFAADNFSFMYAFSVLSGIGQSMIWAPCMVIIGQYFRKYHATASAIFVSGSSFGMITCPYIITFLLETYALRGAMLIVGGISLQIISLGSIMRPPEFYSRFSVAEEPSKCFVDAGEGSEAEVNNKETGDRLMVDENEVTVDDHHGTTKELIIDGKKPNAEQNRSRSENIDGPVDAHDETTTELIIYKNIPNTGPNTRQIALSPTVNSESLHPLYSADSIRSSMLSLYAINDVPVPLTEIHSDNLNNDLQNDSNSCKKYNFFLRRRTHNKKPQLVDVSLLKDIPFVCYILGSSLYFAAMNIHITFLPLYVKVTIANFDDIAIMLSVFGALELASRYFFGFISDAKFVKPYKILASVCISNGIWINCVGLFSGYSSLIAYHVIAGVFHGGFTVIMPVVIVDLFGHEVHARSWGIIILLRGFLMVALSQSVGYIRDQTGSLSQSFNLIGSSMIFGSFMWLCVTVPILNYRKTYIQNEERNEAN